MEPLCASLVTSRSGSFFCDGAVEPSPGSVVFPRRQAEDQPQTPHARRRQTDPSPLPSSAAGPLCMCQNETLHCAHTSNPRLTGNSLLTNSAQRMSDPGSSFRLSPGGGARMRRRSAPMVAAQATSGAPAFPCVQGRCPQSCQSNQALKPAVASNSDAGFRRGNLRLTCRRYGRPGRVKENTGVVRYGKTDFNRTGGGDCRCQLDGSDCGTLAAGRLARHAGFADRDLPDGAVAAASRSAG